MFLHFVIDSFYSLSVAKLLRKMHPDNRHIFVMMQRSGSSDQYSILQELQEEALTISPSDQTLYDRVDNTWLTQFDRIFIHGLFHSGLVALLLQKVSVETFQKIYFIPYDGEVQLAIRTLQSGNVNAPNVLALQKLINWIIPPGYQETRSEFFNSYDTSHCRFIELDPILVQPLQPLDMNEVESFVRHRVSARERSVTNIMIGHSCARNDNHIKVLNLLSPLAEESVRIILPMAYHVDEGYRQQVFEFGKSIFGHKLDLWKDYTSPDLYKEKLKQIDVAIFDLQELSGMGVITYLLMLGCKIYSSRSHFKKIQSILGFDCTLFLVDDLDLDIGSVFQSLNSEKSMDNYHGVIESRCSLESLFVNWNKLLAANV